VLSKQTILHVVDKMLVELETQLEDRKVELDVTAAAKTWLAAHGYDPLMGARPMARLIQEHIKKPLADAILFGDLQKGGIAVVDCEDDKLVLLQPETETA